MVQGELGRRELSPSHHIARYCRRRDVRNNGAVPPAAFELRPGEEYLSTNWMEYFHESHRQTQIAGVRETLAEKNFRVSRTASFVVLNIGVAVNACKTGLNLDIDVIALGQPHDPSRAGIFGYTEHNTDAAAQLAASVSPNEIHPAAA